MIANAARPGLRRGITLTEILISIMIMGIGLISLATLFPIGLLRLREAQRQTRSAYLYESATSDVNARSLLSINSFAYADQLNAAFSYSNWFYSQVEATEYNPMIQDTPSYGADPYMVNPNTPPIPPYLSVGATVSASGGYGLPFAYDPLWRWQTDHAHGGIYPFDTTSLTYGPQYTPEARFASGEVLQAIVGNDSDGNGAPSAYGLQRLTNFNRPAYTDSKGNFHAAVMPAANSVPNTFVSPEDIVWQNTTTSNYWPSTQAQPTTYQGQYSPVLPDLGEVQEDSAGNAYTTQEWRFSWMITAQQNNTRNGSSFDANIVVFENRAFALDQLTVNKITTYQAAGENVYEGVFGYSQKVAVATLQGYSAGYGAGADQTVLIRWNGSFVADPTVKVGDWIADVTYERIQNTVALRFQNFPNSNGVLGGVPNVLNNGEWDNLPAQRCYWYQVQKITPAQTDPTNGSPYRSMVVYVNRKLEARTLLQPDGGPSAGQPVYMNAVLVCPSVVNVIPQTFFVR